MGRDFLRPSFLSTDKEGFQAERDMAPWLLPAKAADRHK